MFTVFIVRSRGIIQDYSQEIYDGLSEIFLYTDQGCYESSAIDAGINSESDQDDYDKFFELAKEKINQKAFEFKS